jgi:hypothetical protein
VHRRRRAPWVPKLGDYVTVLEVAPHREGHEPRDSWLGRTLCCDDVDWQPARATEKHTWIDTAPLRRPDWVLVTKASLAYQFAARVRRATPIEEAVCRLGGDGG